MATISPILGYRDPRAALEFLCDAFGFERRVVIDGEDGSIAHAELALGDSVVMLATAPGPGGGRPAIGAGAHHLYVTVPDADAHHARAVAAGAAIFEALTDRDYGSREYGATDPEGGAWYFGTYAPEPSSS